MNLDGLAAFLMKVPEGKSSDVVLTLKFIDNASGTLYVGLRDPHVAHDYKFIDLGQTATTGDGSQKIATFRSSEPLCRAILDGPIKHDIFSCWFGIRSFSIIQVSMRL